MKGRGVRSIRDADLQAVTPDAKTKTRFILVDAVGVTEGKKTTVVKLTREAPKAVPTKPNMPLNHDARANTYSASRSAAGD